MLLILWFVNLRWAHRLSFRALNTMLFPFALVVTSELFRIVLQQWGTPDSDALPAEVYLYRGFVFVFLFLAWGAVYFNQHLHGVSFGRDQRLALPHFERIRSVGLLILCLSLIVFWAYVHLVNTAPTYAQNFSWDSEPSFFIDGLTLFHGANYAYIQHPDATTSMLSSAVLALTYPFVNTRDDSFLMYQLQHPALFVAAARLLTTLLCCMCFVALSYLIVPTLRSRRDLLIALGLPVTMYALHPLSFETITLWSHHTLGFALSVLVLLCLLRVMQSGPKLRPLQAIALAAGLMTAGSFFYGPLAVGVVVTTAVCFAWKRPTQPGADTVCHVERRFLRSGRLHRRRGRHRLWLPDDGIVRLRHAQSRGILRPRRCRLSLARQHAAEHWTTTRRRAVDVCAARARHRRADGLGGSTPVSPAPTARPVVVRHRADRPDCARPAAGRQNV
jgi:hypothetical protein